MFAGCGYAVLVLGVPTTVAFGADADADAFGRWAVRMSGVAGVGDAPARVILQPPGQHRVVG
jgi:hypothetical protein